MRARPTPCRAATLALLALGAPLTGFQGEEPALRFAPEGPLRRSFGEDTRFELLSLVDAVSGEELPADEIEFTGAIERRIELVDAFGPLEAGRPQQVDRRFEEASKQFEVELALQGFEELYDAELESPVAGERVQLAWDDDEQAFVASSEEGLERFQLDRLREDCDLRALLPEEAEEGDEWTVPAERLRDLLAPGGRLLFTSDELPDGPYGGLTPVDLVSTTLISVADTALELDGEARLHWTGTQEDTQAVIELELELTLAGSMDEDLARLCEDMGAGGKRDVVIDYSWSLEGRGQLVWELEAGHFQGLELSLDGEIQLEMRWSGVDGEEGMQVGLATTTELSAECEPE